MERAEIAKRSCGAKEEGYANLTGNAIFHNYFRPHEGLDGKTHQKHVE
jgi:hypothetical protein